MEEGPPQEAPEEIPGEYGEEQEPEPDPYFKIVMIRSGECEWHKRNMFNGWHDSKLTPYGKKEMIEASKILKAENYTFDIGFSSVLSRGVDSLSIILNELELTDIPIHKSWHLNERHYGALTGFNKAEMAAKYGHEQLKFWTSSFDHFPPPIMNSHKYYIPIYESELYTKVPTVSLLPLSESLEMTKARVVRFWKKEICPNIINGKKVLLLGHNRALQGLIQYLDDLESTDFSDVKIPRGTPFYYKLDETLKPVNPESNITLDKNVFIPRFHRINDSFEINNDLDRRIADAFLVFDHAGNKTVDVREIGTILRSLGCIPSEADIQEILVETENRAATGSVHLSKFLPMIARLITEHKMQPAPPDKLLEAFRVIDKEGHGYITKETLSMLMTQEGEPFTEEELEEMMATACDPHTQSIPYEYYINQLMYEVPEELNIFVLADKIEAARPKKKKKTRSEMMAEAAAAMED